MASSADSLTSLAVLVVNYGSHALVETNLVRSLGGEFAGRVIIVDNFTTSKELSAITAVCACHGWELLALPDNKGFGGGNNRAAALATNLGATELLLLNPDAWIDLSAIRVLHEQVRADPLLQLAPEVLRPDGTLYTAEVDLHLHEGAMRATRRRPANADPRRIHTWVSGACFMMSARLWETVGGFDEDYFLYWEDVDLSRRVVEVGGHVRADASVNAVHEEGGTHRERTSGRAKSPTYYYHNTRNRLLYATKHLSREDARRWVRATPRASYRILLQGGRRQFVHPLLTFLPALRGSVDGVRFWRAATHSDDAV